MGEHKVPKDPIEAAIESEDAKAAAQAEAEQREADGEWARVRHNRYPAHFTANFTFRSDGTTMEIIVPHDFDSDKFETAIGILTQLRAIADEKKAAEAHSGLVVPTKPTLVASDGRRLS